MQASLGTMDLDGREPPREPPEPAALRPATRPPETRLARAVALILIGR